MLIVCGLVWPGTLSGGAGDPQIHTQGRVGRCAYKQNRENNLRRKVNLLNMILECRIAQYNTIYNWK